MQGHGVHLCLALFQFEHSKAEIPVGGELSEGIIGESKPLIEAREIDLRWNIVGIKDKREEKHDSRSLKICG